MISCRNSFLHDGFSDESDHDVGYDSEAGEASKGGGSAPHSHSAKRRKLSHSSNEKVEAFGGLSDDHDEHKEQPEVSDPDDDDDQEVGRDSLRPSKTPKPLRSSTLPIQPKKKPKEKDKKKPGVVYLSSLPPYLRPSALKNLLHQRGFTPISRLFLTPASKASHGSKKNSRQLYTEGWIEFGSKKIARRCAETLNASPVGGKKGGFYHDDVWNMKYLKGMAWDELMAGIREERREEENRRDEERRIINTEAMEFVEGVERNKVEEGMRRKRKKDGNEGGGGQDKRVWRQFEVKGRREEANLGKEKNGTADVKSILEQVFL